MTAAVKPVSSVDDAARSSVQLTRVEVFCDPGDGAHVLDSDQLYNRSPFRPAANTGEVKGGGTRVDCRGVLGVHGIGTLAVDDPLGDAEDLDVEVRAAVGGGSIDIPIRLQPATHVQDPVDREDDIQVHLEVRRRTPPLEEVHGIPPRYNTAARVQEIGRAHV